MFSAKALHLTLHKLPAVLKSSSLEEVKQENEGTKAN